MVSLAEQVQTPAVTDYLDYFGLQEDPFPPKLLLPFYDGGGRRELFAELLHLCQFSASALVVLGEEGIGKASLGAELCQHFGDRDLICEIDVPLLYSGEQLLAAVTEQLAISAPTDDPNQAVAQIRQTVHDSDADDSLKVVLVQNAHNLDAQSLQLLLRLAAPAEQSPYRQLHLVLFASPEFEERLQQQGEQNLLQVFKVPPIAAKDMKHYLRFRLDAAGFSGIFPFKDSDIQFLWDISKGLPGKFHDAAREILIEQATPAPENKTIGLPVTHMLAIVFLLAGLLLVFLYRGEDETTDNLDTNEIAVAVEPPSAMVLDAEEELTTSPNLQRTIPEPTALEPTEQVAQSQPPSLGDDSSQQAETIQQNDAEAQGEDEEVVTNSLEIAVPDNPQKARPPAANEDDIDSLIAAVQQERVEDITEPTPPPIPAASQGLTADEDNLLKHAPSDFTLQILASGSRQAVEDFLARQPNRGDLSLFTANRNGRTLYIVVLGSFPSSEAARLAVGTLPQEQKTAGPWPRSFQSVQADIREFRGF